MMGHLRVKYPKPERVVVRSDGGADSWHIRTLYVHVYESDKVLLCILARTCLPNPAIPTLLSVDLNRHYL